MGFAALNRILRVTSRGNLVNVGSVERGETHRSALAFVQSA